MDFERLLETNRNNPPPPPPLSAGFGHPKKYKIPPQVMRPGAGADLCAGISWKNNKPKTTENKEQNNVQTENHYIQQLTKNWRKLYIQYTAG